MFWTFRLFFLPKVWKDDDIEMWRGINVDVDDGHHKIKDVTNHQKQQRLMKSCGPVKSKNKAKIEIFQLVANFILKGSKRSELTGFQTIRRINFFHHCSVICRRLHKNLLSKFGGKFEGTMVDNFGKLPLPRGRVSGGHFPLSIFFGSKWTKNQF